MKLTAMKKLGHLEGLPQAAHKKGIYDHHEYEPLIYIHWGPILQVDNQPTNQVLLTKTLPPHSVVKMVVPSGAKTSVAACLSTNEVPQARPGTLSMTLVLVGCEGLVLKGK